VSRLFLKPTIALFAAPKLCRSGPALRLITPRTSGQVLYSSCTLTQTRDTTLTHGRVVVFAARWPAFPITSALSWQRKLLAGLVACLPL
jgi:hypothetical protein